MFSSNPLLAWCRGRRPVSPIRRAPLVLEPLEVRCVPANINVTTFADGGAGSGSLRAAIIAANTTYQNQTNTITLGTGTYKLSIAGANENAAAKGDLDITGTQTLVIQGAGAGVSIIDAQQLDRVFDVIGPGVTVTFKNLRITGGNLDSTSVFINAGGGILNTSGNVTIDGVTISGNRASAQGQSFGGGVYSDGGSLLVKNSTITNNQVSFISWDGFQLPSRDGADGADGKDDFFSTDPPEPGKDGGLALSGIGGADAYGGGIYAKNASVQILDSTISSNQATGGNGLTGGQGGDGGDGGGNNLSGAGHGLGGKGGAGGEGGAGGNAGGAAIVADGGTLSLTNVQITGNTATGGTGGTGGSGGDGGYFGRGGYSGPGSPEGGGGGLGGDGGAGGEASGAVRIAGSTVLNISGGTQIANNSATGGKGGTGGVGGATTSGELPVTGVSGAGGAGGDVNGAGVLVVGGTATLTGVVVQSNTGVGGNGGDGGLGRTGYSGGFQTIELGVKGGVGGVGGTGGTVSGVGVSIASATATLTDTFISQNQATAGNAGNGGTGGAGGNGAVYYYVIGFGFSGGDGATGGDGGEGGSVLGSGLTVRSSTLTARGVTVADNAATAGTPGNAGDGGRGGNGGDPDVGAEGSGGYGGDGGNGGQAGSVRGAGVYLDTMPGSTLANVTFAQNTQTTPTVTTKGGAAGSGGSGDGGKPGNAGNDWSGAALNEAAGAYLRGTATIVNTTIAQNSSGIAGGGEGIQFGNTIIAKNTGTDVNASISKFLSAGHNIIGTQVGTTGFGVIGDLMGIDPRLSNALGLNGGKTPNYGLLSSSPAKDAGLDPATVLGSALATDQRGFPRSIGASWDIGAVEDATDHFTTDYNIPGGVFAGSSATGTAGSPHYICLNSL